MSKKRGFELRLISDLFISSRSPPTNLIAKILGKKSKVENKLTLQNITVHV